MGIWMGHVGEGFCGREREQAAGKLAELMVCVHPLPWWGQPGHAGAG